LSVAHCQLGLGVGRLVGAHCQLGLGVGQTEKRGLSRADSASGPWKRDVRAVPCIAP
jgi:hypothetical protein